MPTEALRPKFSTSTPTIIVATRVPNDLVIHLFVPKNKQIYEPLPGNCARFIIA